MVAEAVASRHCCGAACVVTSVVGVVDQAAGVVARLAAVAASEDSAAVVAADLAEVLVAVVTSEVEVRAAAGNTDDADLGTDEHRWLRQ